MGCRDGLPLGAQNLQAAALQAEVPVAWAADDPSDVQSLFFLWLCDFGLLTYYLYAVMIVNRLTL